MIMHFELNKKFIKELLEIFSELTNMSIALYIFETKEYIYTIKYKSELCPECNRYIKFNESYSFKKGLHQCPAGLWYYSLPLIIDDELIGCYIIGHYKINGKEDESKIFLEKTIIEQKLDRKSTNRLLKLLETVECVKLEKFDDILLEKLSFITNYILEEKKRVYKEYQRSIAFKNEAENLAHEFLLPIQSIIANAENLMVDASEVEKFEIKNLAEDILQEVIKLSYIAENIRGSFIESSEYKSEFQIVNVIQTILDTIELFNKEANKKNIEITFKLTDSFKQKEIEASNPLIKQLFFNLIHNAVKYSFSGTNSAYKYITITCDNNRKNFICEISNYGIGILPEEIEQKLISQKGYRGMLSRDRSRTGSGFGLFKVYEIIKAHNGQIKVESRKVGTGLKIDTYITTFKISLPCVQTKEVKFNGITEDFMGRR